MLKLNFTTLSPLHISSGRALAYNLEYIVKDENACLLNINALSSFLAKKNAFDFLQVYDLQKVKNAIKRYQNEYSNNEFSAVIKINKHFRDHLQNERADGKKEFMEFINTGGNYYVPGSSVKGALLTILHLFQLGIENSIDEKFVIHDSAPIPHKNLSVYRTANRPPAVNLMCIDPNVSFSLIVPKKGKLDVATLQKKLINYTDGQISKAITTIAKYKSKSNRKPNGADLYMSLLENLQQDSKNGMNLINLGFGGGSWFKIYSDVTPPPKFKNRGKMEEAHTTFSFNINEGLVQAGWCKMTIEEN